MEGKDVTLVKNIDGEIIINLYDEINTESTYTILEQLKLVEQVTLEVLENNAKLKPEFQEELPVVRIYNYCYGGSMIDTFAIANMILKLRKMGVYFINEANAFVASGGFYIMMCCNLRTVTNEDFFECLYHQMQTQLPFGNGNVHVKNLKRWKDMLDRFKDIIVENSKVTYDILDKYEEVDWHIDLKTARELEIINDHIEEQVEPVEIKMSDMIKQLESSGYTVINDLKETKEKTKKTKKENK